MNIMNVIIVMLMMIGITIIIIEYYTHDAANDNIDKQYEHWKYIRRVKHDPKMLLPWF